MDPQGRKRVAAVSTTVYTATLNSLCSRSTACKSIATERHSRFVGSEAGGFRRWDLRRLRSRPTGWRLVALPPVDPRRSLGWTTCAGSMASIPPSSHTPG